jgi:hypothetical protein
MVKAAYGWCVRVYECSGGGGVVDGESSLW